MARVRRYLSAHADEAGEIFNLAPDRIAVGFTANGCLHRRGLAQATGEPESNIIVFRAAHPSRSVAALHEELTEALASERHPELNEFDIVQWGPTLQGCEQISILPGQSPETLRARLAELFAGGDQTMFEVSTMRREDFPTTAR